MKSFVYNALPSRVVFGNGTLSRVVQEITTLMQQSFDIDYASSSSTG